MMCAAALFACAGAVADDGGSDPVVLTPGGWTTGLTVNGRAGWSVCGEDTAPYRATHHTTHPTPFVHTPSVMR